MNGAPFITWVWANREIISLFAVVATALGTIYQPTRDLLKALSHAVLTLVKITFQILWFVTWPLRKIVKWAYIKFLSDHIDNFFNRIFDWFEKRGSAKEGTTDINDVIKVTDL